jgi:hypothetical protein
MSDVTIEIEASCGSVVGKARNYRSRGSNPAAGHIHNTMPLSLQMGPV